MNGPTCKGILRDQADVLEEGLLIISEEFSNWDDSSRRIDLLGLGRDGHLVVIELKRDERGGAMELQAIRYAAMVSNVTLEQVIDAYASYLIRRGVEVDARERILEHLGATELVEPAIYSERPRIILVSGDFSKELTTSVLWLNQVRLDIRCVRLRPYRTAHELLIDLTQIIPLPEAEQFLVQVREKSNETQRKRSPSGLLVQGVEAFHGTIQQAPEQNRPDLERCYDWALTLN